MAKGPTGMQSGQSTHAGGRNTLDQGVSSTLSVPGIKAGEDPEHRFRGLARLLDRRMLGEAFRRLKRRAAPGIDGVTHDEYAKNLDENLLSLEARLKEGIGKVIAKESKGSVPFLRYADDSVVCFERKDEAEAQDEKHAMRLHNSLTPAPAAAATPRSVGGRGSRGSTGWRRCRGRCLRRRCRRL